MTKQINIPCNWFKHICHETGSNQQKVDLLAINVLAEIVGNKDYFVNGLLRKNQDDFAPVFNVSPQQIRRSMKTLEKIGLIAIHLLPYKVEGEKFSIPNVMHISINLLKIEEITSN